MNTKVEVNVTVTKQSAPRKATAYRVLVSLDDGDTWMIPDITVEGRTSDEAMNRAMRKLDEDGYYASAIQNDGLVAFVFAARAYKPAFVKAVPQPSKIVCSTHAVEWRE